MNLLFVSGTLHPDRAPKPIRDVTKKMVPIGQGTIAGNLHDLGEYPALTLDNETNQRVRGAVFELPNDPVFIQSLTTTKDTFLTIQPTVSSFGQRPHHSRQWR